MEPKIPQIVFENVENVAISTKKVATPSGVKHVARVSFEVDARPQDVARALYFNRQNVPINVIVESPQAQFDLAMTPVSVATGEIAPDQMPGFLR